MNITTKSVTQTEYRKVPNCPKEMPQYPVLHHHCSRRLYRSFAAWKRTILGYNNENHEWSQIFFAMKKIFILTYFSFLLLFIACNQSSIEMKTLTIKGIGIVDWATLNEDGSLAALGNGHVNGVSVFDTISNKTSVVWESKKWNSNAIATGAAFHPFLKHYLACCDAESVGLVDLHTGHVLFRLTFEYGYAPGIDFSNDGSYVMVVHSYFNKKNMPENWDHTRGVPVVSEVLFIDINTKNFSSRIELSPNIVTDASFNTNKDLLALRYLGGE